MGLDILQLNPTRIHSLVRAGAWPLQCESHARLPLNWHPAELHVPEEHHSVWSPILHGVWKNIDVHEGTPGLAGPEMAQLSIGMSQSERGLSCIRARPEKLEFEDRFQCAGARRNFRFGSKARLPDTEISIAVGAELIRPGREFDWAYDVEPIRVYLLEVIARIHHGEPIDL